MQEKFDEKELSAPTAFKVLPKGVTPEVTDALDWVVAKKGSTMSREQAIQSLDALFTKYQIPLGLLVKCKELSRFSSLQFIVDDSGSMSRNSDLLWEDAEYIKEYKSIKPQGGYVSRWEEVENRLHLMIDLLAWTETGPIVISFFNNAFETITLNPGTQSPQQFAAEAHIKIHSYFSTMPPLANTPLKSALNRAFRKAKTPTAFYLLTDGKPSDATEDEIAEIIRTRKNPEDYPLSLLSCTNETNEVAWLKTVEGEAPYVSELDDYETERLEVKKGQGAFFPFTYGFWLLCQLVAAMNPDDLDALDEPVPMTRKTLTALMGRALTDAEYSQYFNDHPGNKTKNYQRDFARFNKFDGTTRQLLGDTMQSQSELSQHYPEAYCSLWSSPTLKNRSSDHKIRAILDDYTKSGSRWMRLAHFHFNRHHCEEVEDLLLTTKELDGPSLLAELKKIDRRPNGSLDRRIQFIEEALRSPGQPELK